MAAVCDECYTIIGEDEGNLKDHKNDAHSLEAFIAKSADDTTNNVEIELPE
jgi:hypothetical protein